MLRLICIQSNYVRKLRFKESFDVACVLIRRHPDGPVVLYPNQRSILYQSGFNSTLPTIFIIHGYTDHKDRDVIVALRKGM